ncbi:MAG: hypothetical protein VXZ96_12800 [Myxococcota bacterium]|nr:hypothetical protein [Myxococcota bacterium]
MSDSQMDDILKAAQAQVQEILQHKVETLQALIAENKASTEALMELRIQHAQQQSLAQQQINQLNELKPLVEALETDVQELQNKYKQLNQHIQELERQKLGLKREVEKYETESQRHHSELEQLNQSAETLKQEVEKKAADVQLLEKRIEGMRKLRDEHMLSIMNLTHELSNISSGADDTNSKQ